MPAPRLIGAGCDRSSPEPSQRRSPRPIFVVLVAVDQSEVPIPIAGGDALVIL
jgi:hypothetical protein